MTTLMTPAGYESFLKGLKERVRAAQLRAGLSVNRDLVLLYWSIGRDILARQKDQGWGAKVIDRLANDLRREFPAMTGLSPRNLKYMRTFAEAWPDEQIVQAPLAQMTWYHNIALIEKLTSTEQRLWYARKAIENGWSRSVLVHQIESELYRRQGKAPTNFTRTLPTPQSELAQQVIKGPYNFEFLTLAEAAKEQDLERALIDHLRDFLLELGVGFAFVGSQYRLVVGGQEYRLDLLFYHLHLRAYVVIELKAEGFKPEFSGKMNFYLSAVDDILRHSDDRPSVGIILCKSKNKVVAEYAVRDLGKPVGIAEYRVTNRLPRQFHNQLPTIEELESELGKVKPR
jgi:predicted nuclease of restriction endonuclease-like (RecB) superfamily